MSGQSRRSSKDPILLYDSTDRSADLYWFSGFHAPDAYLAFGFGRRKLAVLSELEFNRGCKEGDFDEVLPLREWLDRAEQNREKGIGIAGVIAEIAEKEGVSRFQVPANFPLALARKLERLGVEVVVHEGELFPQRLIKSKREVSFVREGCAASAAGLERACQVLREAEIRYNRQLWWNGARLTSERLRFEVDLACMNRGARADQTIVAGGDQACDPHCRGSGPLKAGELIIVDVFPRVEKTGYFGDMTRTFLKGTPSDDQVRLVKSVRDAQKKALNAIRAGVQGSKVHRTVESHFERLGYQTGKVDGVYRGFFHSTGHGLGLEIHEGPRLGNGGAELQRGMVVTVEPGLYYPGLGGVRIEDVVCVTEDGCELLSNAPYDWIL
jgi:Xaa-Pro aminopeptidase